MEDIENAPQNPNEDGNTTNLPDQATSDGSVATPDRSPDQDGPISANTRQQVAARGGDASTPIPPATDGTQTEEGARQGDGVNPPTIIGPLAEQRNLSEVNNRVSTDQPNQDEITNRDGEIRTSDHRNSDENGDRRQENGNERSLGRIRQGIEDTRISDHQNSDVDTNRETGHDDRTMHDLYRQRSWGVTRDTAPTRFNVNFDRRRVNVNESGPRRYADNGDTVHNDRTLPGSYRQQPRGDVRDTQPSRPRQRGDVPTTDRRAPDQEGGALSHRRVRNPSPMDGDQYTQTEWGTTTPHGRGEEGLPSSLGENRDGHHPSARKSIIPIDMFSGKAAEDVTDFKENFYRASAVNSWSTQLTRLILPSYLGGRARDFYNNLSPDTKASTSRAFTALETHFNSSAIRYQARNTVHDRIQKPNESVADYYQNMSTLVRKAWGGLSRNDLREKLSDCFVRGLRHPIKKIFFDREPSSVEEALREAEGREIYLKSKQKALSVNQVDAEKRATRGGESENTDAGQIEMLRREMADLKAQILTRDERIAAQGRALTAARVPVYNDDKAPARPLGSPVAPRNVGFREPPACWSCGSRSHFRADCPNLGTRDGGASQK